MCWACNPLCGKCKPPKKRMARCPECGTPFFYSLEDSLSSTPLPCPSCSADLSDAIAIKPIDCQRCAEQCAWPCANGNIPLADGIASCAYRTDPRLLASADRNRR